MTDREMIAFVKKLNDAGIQLIAEYEPIGCNFGLRAADLPHFLRDKNDFFASECAMSKQAYLEWKAFMRSGRPCQHKGRLGACARQVAKSAELSPGDYMTRRKLETLLCARHLREREERQGA
jgi:hypothetical protein